MTYFELSPLSNGYAKTYFNSSEYDPRITNAFATAGFRFGHSLIPSEFKNMKTPSKDASGRQSKNFKLQDLRSIFNKPGPLADDKDLMTGLVRGMSVQKSEEWDEVFAEDIVNHLFEMSRNDKHSAMDLIALNIQRGRDHGLPGYNSYREVCGIKKAATFDDLRDSISKENVEILRRTYEHVDDIDLFVGGFLEIPDTGAILAQVFRCIVGDTFQKLKFGDRFWYDLGKDPKTRFSLKELKAIRRVRMSRIICDNTVGLEEIQPFAFRANDLEKNKPTLCKNTDTIPKLDIIPFNGIGAKIIKKNKRSCDKCLENNTCLRVNTLCMHIESNSNGFLNVTCMDEKFDIGTEVEWEINSETLPGTNNTKIHSAISLDWNNLKQDGKNQVICRIKNHPSDNPNYQEISGIVDDQKDDKFSFTALFFSGDNSKITFPDYIG